MTGRSWEQQKDEICGEICSNHATLKIILKTKNERLFIKKWVDHHIKIVGADGIIIFDNESDDTEVVRYLDQISRYVKVYRFASMHNSIHNSAKLFADLYTAVRASTDYYIFLDTDEFLFWANEDGSYFDDGTVVTRVVAAAQRAIPGIWAHNQRGHDRKLRLSFRNNNILSGIRAGKPIVSSAVAARGLMAHNIQFPVETFDGGAVGNLIIGHLKYFSREQRIAANIEKLRSYNRATNVLRNAGIEDAVITLDHILAVDTSALKANALTYVTEIRRLVAGEGLDAADDLANVPAVLFEDGLMSFVNDRERNEVLGFLRDPASTIAAGLRSKR